MSLVYYKVKDEKQEYLGERYFAFDWTSEKVIQICCMSGDMKRGKSNNVGIYLIGKLTLLSNYMAMNYLVEITKKTYTTKFKQVIKVLSLASDSL